MRGRVIKSTGSWYQVCTEDAQLFPCRIKGKFRLNGIKHTNPITVGDWVNFELEGTEGNGVIDKIEDRQNYIIRKSNNLSKQTHIIASNIDQAVLIVSLVSPRTSTGFIDRFLLTAEAYHIPCILVFNKHDLMNEGFIDIQNELINLYQKIGYTCIQTSVKTGYGLEELKELLRNKNSLLSGHSGVGKSSLINAIEPSLDLKTAIVSAASNKGQHTTTFAEMHPLQFGGYLIDTPGIREFGVVDISKQELSHFFKEMKGLIGQCKFNNCIHLNEPGCAIMESVNEGKIDIGRYQSYLSILNNEDIYE
jgi:ribosome biogenesis GTPase